MIAMHDHYDRLENRTASARESALFRDLRHVLGVAKPRVPQLRAQLKGINLATLQSRADLAAIPILRRDAVCAMQAELPPFGGLTATRLPLLKQVFVGLSHLVAIEGQAKDWWGSGRALYAAGLRKGTLALNCFSYDLVPHGHIIASGAQAIGCPIVPAGSASIAAKVDVVQHLKPAFFCGAAGHLKELLDYGEEHGKDVSSLKKGLVTGHMSAGLRSEYALRDVAVFRAIILPEIGAVAFETGLTDGMTINEGLIVEIVDPATSMPVPVGTDGELVVSRINADFPLLRFATGITTRVLSQPSACGRTNMRLAVPGPQGCDGMGTDDLPINATHLQAIRKIHPFLGRMRVFMRRPDTLHLKAEHAGAQDAAEHVSETIQLITRMRNTVEFVEPGSLSEDDAPIVDERSFN